MQVVIKWVYAIVLFFMLSCFRLVKEGFFGKAKVCYFITRTKDKMDSTYLEQVYEELRRQAAGENIFNSDKYIE